MINKKIGLILSSVIAGVGLVGATFAAWAVTDNANPLGIKISPTTIHHDTDEYSTMVLAWGDKTGFSDIENLSLEGSVEKTLQVVSTYTKVDPGDTQKGGNLSVKLLDITPSHVQGAPKLVDNLVVKTYVAEWDSEHSIWTYDDVDPVAALQLDNTHKTANADIETESGTPTPIKFKVEFAEGVTQVQYNQMVSDLVYLEVDWNKPSGAAVVQKQTIYFKTPNIEGYQPYAYLFDDSGESINENAEWPGELMTAYNAAERIYSIEVNMAAYKKVVFSNNKADQTADLTIPLISANTPYYNGTAWVAAPAKGEVVNPVYYLVGTMTGWQTQAQYLLSSPDEDGTYTINVTVPESGIEFKVLETTTNTYYGYSSTEDGTPNCNWGSAGNITVSFNPGKKLVTNTQYIDAALAS